MLFQAIGTEGGLQVLPIEGGLQAAAGAQFPPNTSGMHFSSLH
jgi:hypothetical protein